MIPNSKPPSPDSAKKEPLFPVFRKSSFNSLIQSSFSLHSPRSWLFISLLSFQIILFLMLRSIPVSFSPIRLPKYPSADISGSISHVDRNPSPYISGSISPTDDSSPDTSRSNSFLPENNPSPDSSSSKSLVTSKSSLDTSSSVSLVTNEPTPEDTSSSASLVTNEPLPKDTSISTSVATENPKPNTSGSISVVTENSNPDASGSISLVSDQCSSGRIYIYDVPNTLNEGLLKNCHELKPFGSRCESFVNDGFGPQATGLYGVVPDNLIPAWYWTDQFALEILYHKRILNHKCRTLEPESATAFYMPFYVGLGVGKHLWKSFDAKDRDRYCETMMKWLEDHLYWNRSNGWDHFIAMGRITWDFRRTPSKVNDWGSSCIHMPGMRNVTRLLIERNPWDYFDIGVPYPTGFHPRSDSDVLQWQDFVRNRKRSSLFCFAGAKRGSIKNDFRSLLLTYCRSESPSCRLVDCSENSCSNGTSLLLETFLDSDFCLQPRGDSFTRRSIFDCMVAGSIPVLFWKRSVYYQYQWFLPDEPGSYSVFIDRNEVKNGTKTIKSVLESYSREEVNRMREKVIEYIPKFLYAKPPQGLETIKDAFDIAIDGVLKRFKEQDNWDRKW